MRELMIRSSSSRQIGIKRRDYKVMVKMQVKHGQGKAYDQVERRRRCRQRVVMKWCCMVKTTGLGTAIEVKST